MNKRVADSAERQRALTPDESFIVQAPAGSGKTELLIQRYLRLLAGVDAPEEIIAITFTRKAAAEMRVRILNALERAAADRRPEGETRRETHELARLALLQDQKHGWQLRINPGRLRIQTIDSLCGALTRQMPLLSGFGAQPETMEDAAELYQQAAAATLAELESGAGWSASIAVLLNHLDNDLPRIRNMLVTMLSRRDQWLRHVAVGVDRGELEAALRHAVEAALFKVRQQFPGRYIPELITLLDYAAGNLQGVSCASSIHSCLQLEGLPQARADALIQWRGITDLLLTGKGEWRKQGNVKIGFPPADGGKAEKETRKQMKERLGALLAILCADEQLHRQLLEIRSLPPVTYSDSEWQVVEALCQLLILADAQLRVLFAENNCIDFSGITQAAIQALGGTEEPTDLALHLDYRIKHILVDEFQDISINQYLLLERLSAGWTTADGRTLFLVGDPMQSIYRFREAEVGIFLNVWQQQRLGQVAVTPLHINVNFRSRSAIVEWVNHAFTEILPGTMDIGRGAVNYTGAVAFHDEIPAGAVRIHPVIGRNDRHEAAVVLEQIRRARQADPQGTIAILVRSRTHLLDIVPCLKQAGLRYRAVEIEGLGSRTAIQDLLALTRALTHYADRIAWLALLRAPWCGVTLSDLFKLVGDEKEMSVWASLQDEARIELLSHDGRQRLLKLRRALQDAFDLQRRLPLHRWIEAAWLRIGGPATLVDDTDLENARTFFQLLERFDEAGDLRDRDRFMQQVSALFAAPDVHADAGLQIMTIHKSKGLEFDTVILPGLSRRGRHDETQLLLWAESPHQEHQDLLLAPVKEAGDAGSPVYDFLKRLQAGKRYYEDGRLLYVAATRAKRALHLIGSVAVRERDGAAELCIPPSGSLLGQLWPVVAQEFESAFGGHRSDDGALPGETAAISRGLRRFTPAWRLPPAPAAVVWERDELLDEADEVENGIEFEWAGQIIKHIGTVVHRCIQRIAEQGLENWDEANIRSEQDYYRTSLKRLGVPDKEIGWAAKRVVEALIGLIGTDRGRWLLDGEHREARNEYAISGIYQGRLINVIIDRTFIDGDGNRWIVDYKTSRHESVDVDRFLDQEQERYREQLQKYAALMKGIDTRPIRLGLYFPLLEGWREWEYVI